MAQTVKVSTDLAALDRKLRERIDRLPRAAAAGINRVAKSAYTLAVREIQKDTGATAQKTIRRNMAITTATAAKPIAVVAARASKQQRIPIYELNPKPKNVTKRRPPIGVAYGGGNSGLAKVIPGSFIAAFKSGHKGVFKRIPVSIRKQNYNTRVKGGALQRVPQFKSSRLPERIAELFGPSVALVFSRRKILTPVKQHIRAKLPAEIARAYKFGEFANG